MSYDAWRRMAIRAIHVVGQRNQIQLTSQLNSYTVLNISEALKIKRGRPNYKRHVI
jgi:hypothetical protein